MLDRKINMSQRRIHESLPYCETSAPGECRKKPMNQDCCAENFFHALRLTSVRFRNR